MTETTCADSITQCKNYSSTVGNFICSTYFFQKFYVFIILAGVTSSIHACGETTENTVGCTETETSGVKVKTCYCKGELCNKFSSAMGIEVSKILIFAGAILAGFYKMH